MSVSTSIKGTAYNEEAENDVVESDEPDELDNADELNEEDQDELEGN